MQCVDYEIQNKIGIVALNRPESLNVVNAQLTYELQEVMYGSQDSEKNS